VSDKHERGYITKHEQIVKELNEMTRESDAPCFSIATIATRLGMDQRTVRAHLKIIEVDNIGVFVDPEQKKFCTKNGILMLAKRLGLKDISDDNDDLQ